MRITEKNTHEAQYLIVEDDGPADDFEEKMLCHLSDPVLLKTAGPGAAVYTCGSDHCAGYDISGLVPMDRALENLSLRTEEMAALLIRLNNAILILEAHLLSDANLILSPDRVYVEPGTLDVAFCPACGREGSFEERVRPFIREIFLHADVNDPVSLRTASRLLKVSMEKQFRMHDLMKVIEDDMRPVSQLESGQRRISARASGEKPITDTPELIPRAPRFPLSDDGLENFPEDPGDPENELSGPGSRSLLSVWRDPEKKGTILAVAVIVAICIAAAVLTAITGNARKTVPAALILIAAVTAYYFIGRRQKQEGEIDFEDLSGEEY